MVISPVTRPWPARGGRSLVETALRDPRESCFSRAFIQPRWPAAQRQISNDETIRLWDLANLEGGSTSPVIPHPLPLLSVSFSPDGKFWPAPQQWRAPSALRRTPAIAARKAGEPLPVRVRNTPVGSGGVNQRRLFSPDGRYGCDRNHQLWDLSVLPAAPIQLKRVRSLQSDSKLPGQRSIVLTSACSCGTWPAAAAPPAQGTRHPASAAAYWPA